jgi:hypothetical protein
LLCALAPLSLVHSVYAPHLREHKGGIEAGGPLVRVGFEAPDEMRLGLLQGIQQLSQRFLRTTLMSAKTVPSWPLHLHIGKVCLALSLSLCVCLSLGPVTWNCDATDIWWFALRMVRMVILPSAPPLPPPLPLAGVAGAVRKRVATRASVDAATAAATSGFSASRFFIRKPSMS